MNSPIANDTQQDFWCRNELVQVEPLYVLYIFSVTSSKNRCQSIQHVCFEACLMRSKCLSYQSDDEFIQKGEPRIFGTVSDNNKINWS